MLDEIPEFREVYDQHMRDCEELLRHPLMGDTTRFVILLYRKSRSEEPGAARAGQTLARTIELLEQGMRSSDDRLFNLVAASSQSFEPGGFCPVAVWRRRTGPFRSG
jgi:hypothetical protein